MELERAGLSTFIGLIENEGLVAQLEAVHPSGDLPELERDADAGTEDGGGAAAAQVAVVGNVRAQDEAASDRPRQ